MATHAWRVYLCTVGLAAGAAIAFAALHATPPAESLVVLGLVALTVAAQLAPIKVGPNRQFTLAQGASFALLLTAGPAAAVILTAAAYLVGQCVMWRRGRRGPVGVILNTAQATLAAGAGGLALTLTPIPILNVVLAGIAVHQTSLLLVGAMLVLRHGRSWRTIYGENPWLRLEQSAAELGLGWLTALAVREPALVPVAMAVPAAALYLAGERLRLLQDQSAETKRQTSIAAAYKEFLQVASHELRTPLACLRGYTQLLQRRVTLDREVTPVELTRVTAMIDGQADKLSRLISQFLDLSRIELDKFALERESFVLAQIADSAAAAVRATHAQHTIHLAVPDDLVLEADPLRVEQVLVNLLANAAKFSPPEEPILLTAVRHPGVVEIAVRDRGPGVPAEKLAAIFEPFVQAHGNGAVGGLGLGLYITKQIVERHGGEVLVETAPDGGARFVVRLPSPGAAPAAAPAAAPGAVPTPAPALARPSQEAAPREAVPAG